MPSPALGTTQSRSACDTGTRVNDAMGLGIILLRILSFVPDRALCSQVSPTFCHSLLTVNELSSLLALIRIDLSSSSSNPDV